MWWSTASNDTWVEYASWASYTPTWNVTLYAVWKKTITITFNVNWNGWSNSTKTCDMWNNDTSCSITSPAITCNSNTPNQIWWSTWTTIRVNSWTWNTSKNISADTTYYAQCKSNQWTYNATYKRDTVSTTARTSWTLSKGKKI